MYACQFITMCACVSSIHFGCLCIKKRGGGKWWERDRDRHRDRQRKRERKRVQCDWLWVKLGREELRSINRALETNRWWENTEEYLYNKIATPSEGVRAGGGGTQTRAINRKIVCVGNEDRGVGWWSKNRKKSFTEKMKKKMEIVKIIRSCFCYIREFKQISKHIGIYIFLSWSLHPGLLISLSLSLSLSLSHTHTHTHTLSLFLFLFYPSTPLSLPSRISLFWYPYLSLFLF